MPTILLVDDAAVDRRIVQGILKDQGIEIVEVSNGREALEFCAASTPDLVLTDLQMPEVGGLELTTQLTLQYPNIPIVLMTAHGSEDVAAEALACGAASYVPKAQLARQLLDTVRPILTSAESQDDYRRLIECSTSHQISFCLQNDLSLVAPFVDLIQKIVNSMGVCKFLSRVRFGVAVEQALRNAILHGNYQINEAPLENPTDEEISEFIQRRSEQSPYRDRRVYVDVSITKEEARMLIRDEGDGFDTSAIPAPRSPEAMQPNVGRGLVLMQSFLDEVSFNDNGNEVTLVKHRDT